MANREQGVTGNTQSPIHCTPAPKPRYSSNFMLPPNRRAAVVAALAVCAIFFVFAGDGIRAYFTPDDMMNLYVSWSASPAELLHNARPLGALVYRVMFAIFGLHPMPYRVLCFGLLLANLALLYGFFKRLSGSREVAALACLLGAYHAHLADLYYSTGTLYDLLCCLFFLLAFNLYLRIRETAWPSWTQTAQILALYACALASKEMAVLLPVYIVLYECIYHWFEWRRIAALRFLWLAIPITAVYAALKLAGPHAMTANPAYAQHLSLHVFLTGWKSYLNDLFYNVIAFNTAKLVVLWMALVLAAVAMRRKEAWFGWCVLMLGVLPFIFIPPRGFFVMYLVLPGWCLFGAACLAAFRDWLAGHFSRWAEWLAVRPAQLALFAIVALLLIPLHREEKPRGNSWVAASHQQIREILGPLAARIPTLPAGAKVLFLTDPYDPDDWILTSTLRLQYRDPTLHVDRAKADPSLAGKEAEYQHVFLLGPTGLSIVK